MTIENTRQFSPTRNKKDEGKKDQAMRGALNAMPRISPASRATLVRDRIERPSTHPQGTVGAERLPRKNPRNRFIKGRGRGLGGRQGSKN